MVSQEQLLYERRVLVASLEEVAGVVRSVRADRGDTQPYVNEAMRLVARLRKVQQEIEDHDLD